MTDLILNEEHQYFQSGRRLIGFHEALESVGLIDTSFYTDEARERGTLVHEMAELFFLNDLDEKSIDPALQPYFDALLAFSETHGSNQIFAVEPLLAHPLYRYGVRPDLISKIWLGTNVTECADGYVNAAVEIKTGAPQFWHILQGSAQVFAWNSQKDRSVVLDGFVLCYLNGNGEFSVSDFVRVSSKRYNDSLRAFLNALATTQLKFEHGLHK